MEWTPGVSASVEGVEIIWVGSEVCFSAVDDDDVVSPECCTVTASLCGGRR